MQRLASGLIVVVVLIVSVAILAAPIRKKIRQGARLAFGNFKGFVFVLSTIVVVFYGAQMVIKTICGI